MQNIILNTDSYKASHFKQYPPGTEYVESYIEPRIGSEFDEVAVFGLQAFIKEYLHHPITMDDILEAEAIFTAHGEPFNKEGWLHILNVHGGFLPIAIDAVPEGTVVPINNVVAVVRNTDPKVPWLVSYLETSILRAIWYPSTVATLSREAKKIITKYLVKTGDPSLIPFKLHDFGARGVSSNESAMLGGMAHLVNFMGTDTVAALVGARRYYGASMPGFSIPAAEHSTITSWGKTRESDAYANMLTQFGGEGKIVAVVSDSYDLFNAIDNIWGDELKDKVLNMGGTLVVRPDSGIPWEIVPQVLARLDAKYGHSINEKGYKVLNPAVRVIQGDGCNLKSIEKILSVMEYNGWSADNVAFGMGGGLLQQVNRDTMRWAMKCSAIRIDGEWHNVQKNPATDPTKASKAGQLMLYVTEDGQYETDTIDVYTIDLFRKKNRSPVLVTMFQNGDLVHETTFEEIRLRAAI